MPALNKEIYREWDSNEHSSFLKGTVARIQLPALLTVRTQWSGHLIHP